ncbi:MAB_1171c family putative transporter [Streptomyces rubellomurinus]|uniref:MAB_1171c family putative transporter n=1 Tax=Streptomyces rubellomurinus (strain ATCC 31215) TaxID=359131 RepID=UPI0006979FC5|nr:MAB_1171c family putative transporter [Streptomyces rubellomurinus]
MRRTVGDRLADAADYLACLVTLVGTAGKAWSDRGRRSDPALRHVYTAGLCMALGLALSAPGTFAAASLPGARAWPWPWLGSGCLRLVGDELELLAVGALAMLAHSIQPPDAVRGGLRAGLRRQAAVTAGAGLLSVTAYVAADPAQVGNRVVVDDGRGRALLVVYVGLLTAHLVWRLVVFGLLVGRSAARMPPGALRSGVRMMAFGTVIGLLWTASNVIDVVEALTTGGVAGGESAASAVVALACVVLMLAGATAPLWRGRLARWSRPLRARYAYRRLEPLWSALRATVPAVELLPDTARTGRRAPHGAQFALYRRVIEIRDGQLALRPYVHPHVPSWVAEFTADAAGRDQLAVTVEAAGIAAALEATAAGHRYPAGPSTGYVAAEGQVGIDEEVAWLVRVADAFAGSPAVAGVRRRVRAELGRGPG